MAQLEIENVSAGYGRTNVLDKVSLVVPEKSIIAVVGPNGHGKTTLLRTVSGLVRANSGTVRLDGRDISNKRPELIARSGIAHVPQGDLLFPKMTVYENLLMGAFNENSKSVIADRIAEVFELFPKLTQLRSQVASALSGGERRMVGLGRGLMAGAPILMIDEPSLGLAPIVIEQVYNAILKLREKGRSILLVEENPDRASSSADYLYLVDNGKVVWSGEGSALLTNKKIIHTYLGA